MRKETMPLWGTEFKPEHDGGEADTGAAADAPGTPPPPPPHARWTGARPGEPYGDGGSH